MVFLGFATILSLSAVYQIYGQQAQAQAFAKASAYASSSGQGPVMSDMSNLPPSASPPPSFPQDMSANNKYLMESQNTQNVQNEFDTDSCDDMDSTGGFQGNAQFANTDNQMYQEQASPRTYFAYPPMRAYVPPPPPPPQSSMFRPSPPRLLLRPTSPRPLFIKEGGGDIINTGGSGDAYSSSQRFMNYQSLQQKNQAMQYEGYQGGPPQMGPPDFGGQGYGPSGFGQGGPPPGFGGQGSGFGGQASPPQPPAFPPQGFDGQGPPPASVGSGSGPINNINIFIGGKLMSREQCLSGNSQLYTGKHIQLIRESPRLLKAVRWISSAPPVTIQRTVPLALVSKAYFLSSERFSAPSTQCSFQPLESNVIAVKAALLPDACGRCALIRKGPRLVRAVVTRACEDQSQDLQLSPQVWSALDCGNDKSAYHALQWDFVDC